MSLERAATPALQTPSGTIVILLLGIFLTILFWTSKEEIDTFFFRLSGGSSMVGRVAAIGMPLIVVVSTICFVLAV